MHQLQASGGATGLERLRLPLTQLGVLVVSGGEFVVDRLDPTGGRNERSPCIPPALFEVDQDAALGHSTVGGIKARIRYAKKALIPNRRRTRRAAVALRSAVWQTAEYRWRFRVLLARLRVCFLWNPQVRGVATESVQMQNHWPEPELHHARPRAPAIDGVVSSLHRTANRRAKRIQLKRLFSDSAVDQIHHTSDAVWPVHQCGGAAHHLDPIDGEWVHRHGVVGAHIGNVQVGAAVAQDLDPVVAQTADHRPARHRAEVTGADTRLLTKGVADGGLEAQPQLLSIQNVHRLGLLIQGPAQGTGGHHDRIQTDRRAGGGLMVLLMLRKGLGNSICGENRTE